MLLEIKITAPILMCGVYSFVDPRQSVQVLLENLQVLLESDVIFLVGNIQFWGSFQVETLFQKFPPLLFKRAKLDLRSTNTYISFYD